MKLMKRLSGMYLADLTDKEKRPKAIKGLDDVYSLKNLSDKCPGSVEQEFKKVHIWNIGDETDQAAAPFKISICLSVRANSAAFRFSAICSSRLAPKIGIICCFTIQARTT